MSGIFFIRKKQNSKKYCMGVCHNFSFFLSVSFYLAIYVYIMMHNMTPYKLIHTFRVHWIVYVKLSTWYITIQQNQHTSNKFIVKYIPFCIVFVFFVAFNRNLCYHTNAQLNIWPYKHSDTTSREEIYYYRKQLFCCLKWIESTQIHNKLRFFSYNLRKKNKLI